MPIETDTSTQNVAGDAQPSLQPDTFESDLDSISVSVNNDGDGDLDPGDETLEPPSQPGESAAEPPAEPPPPSPDDAPADGKADEIGEPEDEEPKIDGKTYRYSENYVKNVLLPARDFTRKVRAEVDPEITVEKIKGAYQAQINLQSIVDDLVHGGSEGAAKIAHEFYETAAAAKNHAAMAHVTTEALSIMRQRHPEWYQQAIVEPLQRDVYVNLQREAAKLVANVRQSEMARLMASGLTAQQAQAELASGKSKEYRDAQWYLWATQKAAADKLGSYLEEAELLQQINQTESDPLEMKRAEIERRERELNERSASEMRARLQQWQAALARDEYGSIQQIVDKYVGAKLNAPQAIKDAVRTAVTQEVDRQLRGNKLFMEQYNGAIRNAQRNGSSEDRQKALKLWQTRADALVRAKAREILAQANSGVRQSNAEAHQRAAEAQKRVEPMGGGQPPKRSIVPPASKAGSAETWEQELEALFQ